LYPSGPSAALRPTLACGTIFASTPLPPPFPFHIFCFSVSRYLIYANAPFPPNTGVGRTEAWSRRVRKIAEQTLVDLAWNVQSSRRSASGGEQATLAKLVAMGALPALLSASGG